MSVAGPAGLKGVTKDGAVGAVPFEELEEGARGPRRGRSRPAAAQPLDYAYNHSEILASVQMERQLSQWLWLNIKAGYQYNLSSDFESKSAESPEFRVEPSHAPFIRIGLFLSPPAHMIK